jgi:hypothetical protein
MIDHSYFQIQSYKGDGRTLLVVDSGAKAGGDGNQSEEEGGLAAEDGVAALAVKGCRFQRTAVSGAGGSDCGAAMQLKSLPILQFRSSQVLQAPIEGPGPTLLVAEGVTGIYWTELHDRPMTYTSGSFRFYRRLRV